MSISVTVFMSTFNGAKYLREQMASILNQVDVNVSLWIRDDGSQDETYQLLSEFDADYGNVHIWKGKPLGVGRSFMQLLFDSTENTDYYAFSDQDDIWDEDKLITAVHMIKEVGDGPQLYVCNQRCVDMNGKYISNRFPQNFPKQRLINELFSNLYAGCTMVFNQELKNLLCDPKRRPDINFFESRIHDAWIACVASLLNSIIYDSCCHMSFRRHNSNVTDAEVTRYSHTKLTIWIKLYYRKVKRRLKKKGYRGHGSELTAKYLLQGYDDLICNDDRELLLLVRDYRVSIRNKLKLLFGPIIKEAAPEKRLYFYIKIIANIL